MNAMNDERRVSRRPRVYQAQILFPGGRASAPFNIEAFDCAGAAAKLAGILSDQPLEAIGVQIVELNRSTIVAANGADLSGLEGLSPYREKKDGEKSRGPPRG